MLFKSSVLLAALALGSSAQNATTPQPTYNVTFLEGLAQFLGTQGLTSLAQAVTTSINSTGTINLLNNINGTGKTLLAPNNVAFTGFQAKYPNASDVAFLGDVLSYHLLSGQYNSSLFSVAPNHTVARTYLNDSAVVQLEGNKDQAIVFAIENNATRVLNQNTIVTLTDTTSYQNLLIYIVDAVVDLPGNATAVLAYNNLTQAASVLSTLNLVQNLTYAKGFTAFIPQDTAFAAASANITALQSNITQLQAVIGNHVINGTTIYSTELGGASATSIAGQSFSFATNSTGSFVTSGQYTAQIVAADLLADNGVIHVIDRVLLNNDTNPSAATSAYSSATAAAATQTAQETGPIGNNAGASGSGTSSGSSGSGSGSSGKNAASARAGVAQVAIVLAGVFAGAVALL